MVYCIVPFCKSKLGKSPGISFHEIPNDMNLREEWLKRISRKDFLPNDASNSSRVCSIHFKTEDFVENLKYRRLKKGTVPSQFPGYPSYKIPAGKPCRRKLEKNVCEPPVKKKKLLTDTAEEEIDCEPNQEYCDKNVQTDICVKYFQDMERLKEKYRLKLYRLAKKLAKTEEKLSESKQKLSSFDTVYHKNLESIMRNASDKESQASFLLEQIKNYSKITPRWSPETLKICVTLNYCSPKAYSFIRRNNIIKLPSKTTISGFVGNICSETGVTPLIKQRLSLEITKLNDAEKFASLVIDEMHIKSQLQYDKKIDCFFGEKDTGIHIEKIADSEESQKDESVSSASNCASIQKENKSSIHLANNLLCFILSGLSTRYHIPVAFFFSKQLAGRDLFLLTKHVMKEVEALGFKIVRIVTDNLKTNVTMMKRFSKGKIKPVIAHPLDVNRLFFLSFDACHILKNIRNLFLDREMSDAKGYISGDYVKKLYEIQRTETVKPVRFLTRKHIDPSNFEKMNVKRAWQIFSPEVIAALQAFSDHAIHHPKAGSLYGAQSTIKYMKHINKWFDIHNVSNRSNHVLTKNVNKMQFFSITDERLEWLENDFIKYMEEIRISSAEDGKSFLTKETYEALMITTRSTVLCTKYLLNSGFHFVLTRSFLSDPVELFFSMLRQMSGGNDMLDCRATVFAINHILKTNMVLSVPNTANVKKDKTSSLKTSSITDKSDSNVSSALPEISKLSSEALNILNQLKVLPVSEKTTMKFAAVSFIAGYVIRQISLNFDCHDCLDNLAQPQSSAKFARLISSQDRGELIYPKCHFVSILILVLEFTEELLLTERQNGIFSKLCTLLLPTLQICPVFTCRKTPSHGQTVAKFVCEKFIPIILKNYAQTQTETLGKKIPLKRKPLSRKVHKV